MVSKRHDSAAERELGVDGAIVEAVLRDGTAVLRPPRLATRGERPPASAAQTPAVLCAPLTARATRLGVLYLESFDPGRPFDEHHLCWLVAVAGSAGAAIEQARHLEWLQGENRRLEADANLEHDMIGGGRAMQAVYTFLAKAAPVESTVLITGENGTGKELVARTIHRNSPRSGHPFVAVNCATLTEPLLASELFGHEKGAFTGAVAELLDTVERPIEGELRLSPDASRLVVMVTEQGVLQGRLFDLARRSSLPLTVPGGDCTAPTWSPDGEEIVVSCAFLGSELSYRLLRFAVDDPATPQPMFEGSPGELVAATDWSPDGAALLVFASRSERTELGLMPARGAPAPARRREVRRAGIREDRRRPGAGAWPGLRSRRYGWPMEAVDLRDGPPPIAWGVTVEDGAIEALAERWGGVCFELPRWDYAGLPRGLAGDDWLDYCLVAVSVLACLWPPEGEETWRAELESVWLGDAPGIFACFTRALCAGRLDLDRLRGLGGGDGADFFAGRGVLQLVPERLERLAAVARVLERDWQGRSRSLVEEAGGDAPTLVGLLAERIPGYRDEAESAAGLLRFSKLAHLAVAMMAARGNELSGLESFPVYPDYMLPRVLRHFGVLVYRQGPHGAPDEMNLAERVDRRGLVPAESPEELAIRWATVYAGERLCRALSHRGNPVIPPALDYHLWQMAVLGPDADRLGEHHRTLTLAY